MSNYISAILIISIFSFGCNNNAGSFRTGQGGIIIDPERIDVVSAFDILSKIEIIPLETTEGSVMDNSFVRLKVHNDTLYVMSRKQECIFVYDPLGRFIRKIDKKGRGPGEYLVLSDFDINRFTGNMELLSATGYINIYDITGTHFIKRIELPHGFVGVHYFKSFSPDIYIFMGNKAEEENIFFYSVEKNKIISKTYNIPDNIISEAGFAGNIVSPFYTYKDSMRFAQVYNGVIFDINENMDMEPRYQWDFGNYNFSIEDIPLGESDQFYFDFRRMASRKYALDFALNGENSKYFITRFRFRNSNRSLIFDKVAETYKLFVEFKEKMPCLPVVMTEDSYYYYASPSELPMAVKPEVLDEKNRQILESVSDDDNLVIIKCSFK